MTKKSFLHLLAKEISGSISRDEQKLLDDSIRNNELFGRVHTEIHRFMQHGGNRHDVDVEAKLNEVWNRINDVHDENVIPLNNPGKRKRILPLWARVAATAAILIGLGTLAYNYLPQQQMLYAETLQAGNENLYAVLDDGTQVWLGKHSRMEYNKRFGAKRREIRLTGEAFFDVAHRPEVPLTVSANKVDVVVKGTAFNVNAAHTTEVAVTLVRGLVAVKDSEKPMSEVLLHPNEKIVVRKTAARSNFEVLNLAPAANDTVGLPETRWITNDVLVFRKQRLQDLAKLMENRFGTRIEITNPHLRDQRFTGSINSESLPQMLDALKQSLPFSYEITDGKVLIK